MVPTAVTRPPARFVCTIALAVPSLTVNASAPICDLNLFGFTGLNAGTDMEVTAAILMPDTFSR